MVSNRIIQKILILSCIQLSPLPLLSVLQHKGEVTLMDLLAISDKTVCVLPSLSLLLSFSGPVIAAKMAAPGLDLAPLSLQYEDSKA